MFALCFLLLPVTVQCETVQLLTFHYPPFMDANKPSDGLMGEIIHAAFDEVGVTAQIVYYPPLRMFRDSIGTQHFLACIGPVSLIERQPAARRSQVVYSPPFATIIMVFYYHEPTHGRKPTTYENFSDLNGFRVGVIRGSNTIKLLDGKGIEIVQTGVDAQMKMLRDNRIDFSAIGLLTGMELIQTLFPGNADDFAFIRKPIMQLPASIYFNKQFPGGEVYPEKFKKGLDALIEKGIYVQILEKYYGKAKVPREYAPIFDALGVQYAFQPGS